MNSSARLQVVPFADRAEAGEELAGHLRRYAGRADVIVLGLPRGGVPVAAAVAGALDAPLDVFTVRKLGVPGHRELAMGAIASGGARVLDHQLIAEIGVNSAQLAAVVAEEEQELARRERLFRRGRPPLAVANRVIILVDDGLATGATMRAAVRAIRALGPARVVVAVPVGSAQACEQLATVADEVACVRIPQHFYAVGQWYRDFSETSDAEVSRLLHERDAVPAGKRR
jgi:putative phosphoribosyl transferase